MRNLKYLAFLFLAFYLVAASSTAVSSTAGTAALVADATLGGLIEQRHEFLPVEEAYKAYIVVEDDHLALHWTIEPEYYLYKDQFQFSGVSAKGDHTITGEFESGQTIFDEFFDKDLDVYYHNTRIVLPIEKLPEEFDLKVRSQGCADAGLCYAPRDQVFRINRANYTADETESGAMGFANRGGGGDTPGGGGGAGIQLSTLLATLLLAMGGGLILNLMPCVFPVLSLKALSFASMQGGESRRQHLHGWAYTGGIIGSFMVAGLIIIAARAAGQGAGWGFQLQSPVFVGALTYLFLVIGLSLSGMVHFGTSLMGVGQGLTATDGLRGSFFTGVLAAVVASPCTGPLMAPALGFALTQPPTIALGIFMALGFGMALPFLLLSYSPKLANMLPRPGAWMERLKELLAFPMYLTAAWLLFVFGRQVGMTGVFFLMLGAVAITFAIWLFQNQPQGRHWRKLVQGSAVAALVFAGFVVFSSTNYRDRVDDWQPYSRQLVQELRSQGQPVFVDFTADWCITCKANEAVALSRKGFKEAVSQYNVALVKGDWTNEDPVISAVLSEFNRSGVPLYLVYPADRTQQPEVLPQLLTQDLVISALRRAAGDEPLAGTDL